MKSEDYRDNDANVAQDFGNRVWKKGIYEPSRDETSGLGQGVKLGYIPPPGEITIVDPKTGGAKGQKLQRFDLIPNEFEVALAEHYGKGATKYQDRNWERGYKWSLSVGALRRHLSAWLDGEPVDSETGSNHLIAVAWHAIALFIFEIRGLGTDDVRKVKGKTGDNPR